MKRDILKKIKFLKKYNYNINEVIGVKNKNKFILYVDKKLIRIYRNKLKSSSLLSTYIPIEHAMFYSFEIDKSIIDKIDLDEFVETKIYEEAGVDETEKYIIKYKVINLLKDEKKVNIEAIIVSESYLINDYKNILEETNYIDYISFPAFAYKALYDQKILKKANDLFIVILYDKIFLTFYHEGELLSIITISGGLDKIYESISKLKIKNFDINIFKKLLQKKGLNDLKYTKKEKEILNILHDNFLSITNLIASQIEKIYLTYNINEIDRIFVTSEYGNIEGLEEFFQEVMKSDIFNFEFYEEYNLDRLAVDPFLFLSMLEAHVAYKSQQQKYNYSLFLRKPTFFYRPSGRLFLLVVATLIISGSYPFYLYVSGKYLEEKVNFLQNDIRKYIIKNSKLQYKVNKLNSQKKYLKKVNEAYKNSLKKEKTFIYNIYSFKYNYIPLSNELTQITLLMNNNNVYLNSLKFQKGIFILDIFSYDDTNIGNFLDSLINNGFNVSTKGIEFNNSKYTSQIRIKE